MQNSVIAVFGFIGFSLQFYANIHTLGTLGISISEALTATICILLANFIRGLAVLVLTNVDARRKVAWTEWGIVGHYRTKRQKPSCGEKGGGDFIK